MDSLGVGSKKGTEVGFQKNVDEALAVGAIAGSQTNEDVEKSGDEDLLDEHHEKNVGSHLAVFADMLQYVDSDKELEELLASWRARGDISETELGNLEAMYHAGVTTESGGFTDKNDPGLSDAVRNALRRLSETE